MGNNRKSTKILIREGFLKLFLSKPYLDITVTDIINTAGVARVSFYRNYSSISDIMDDFLDEATEKFISEVYPVLSGKDKRKWREFLFLAFYEISKKYSSFPPEKFANTGILLGKINAKIQQLKQQIPLDSPYDKYAISGKIGLIINIGKEWFDNGMKETPEEMVNYIMSFILLF